MCRPMCVLCSLSRSTAILSMVIHPLMKKKHGVVQTGRVLVSYTRCVEEKARQEVKWSMYVCVMRLRLCCIPFSCPRTCLCMSLRVTLYCCTHLPYGSTHADIHGAERTSLGVLCAAHRYCHSSVAFIVLQVTGVQLGVKATDSMFSSVTNCLWGGARSRRDERHSLRQRIAGKTKVHAS